jgi:hypothetical protein
MEDTVFFISCEITRLSNCARCAIARRISVVKVSAGSGCVVDSDLLVRGRPGRPCGWFCVIISEPIREQFGRKALLKGTLE